MGMAVEKQRIPAEDNAKNHSEKEDKNGEEEEDTNRSAQPKIDQGAEKRCNDKKSQEEPTSEGGSAMIKKGQILSSKAEKTQVPTDVEEPNDAAQTHLLVVPKDASEKLQLKKTKENKRKRRELKKIKKELGSAEETRVSMDVEEPWKWHASFSSRLLHCSKKKRMDKGFILLQAKVKRVILLDTDETLLDTYYLKEEESIHIGSVLEFPCHKVDVGEPTERGIDNENEKPPSKRNEKRKRLKKNARPLRSPEAALLRSSIGLFARVSSSRKGMSPQAKRRKLESPSIPNVTAHFPSPNFPQRRQPRKLKTQIWKDFIPIYENGKLAQGQCKHCHEVFLASQSSGTNHMHRHVKTCVVRKNMHEMVAKLYASAASPQVPTLDGWNFSQEESRRDLANMIVVTSQH